MCYYRQIDLRRCLLLPILITVLSLVNTQVIATEVRLPGLNSEELQQEITRHQGNVVVLHIWAGWCQHCRAEFPRLVKLDRAYRRKGVTVIAVAVDRAEDSQEVRAFLKTQKTTMPLFRKQYGRDQEFIQDLDPAWSGELPYTRIYDRAGNRISAVTGTQTFTEYVARMKKGLGSELSSPRKKGVSL